MNCFFGLMISLCASQVLAEKLQSNPLIDELFDRAKVQGTIVVYDCETSICIVHSPMRAKERYVPASTFKIANSLIGLSTGAVKNIDEKIPYGGQPQPLKSWERNMGLRDAIKISNVPVYQELARRIGLDRMESNLAMMNYGNGEIGTSIDTFWLEGPLKISAMEQVKFLARLAQDELPFPRAVQADVREIILMDQGDDWKLFGKTGWAQKIGWWVGWVEKKTTPTALH